MFDVGRTLTAGAARDPHRLAIVDGEVRLSYAQLLDQASRVAGGLRAAGLEAGDRLLIVLQNRLEMAVLHWATQLSGIVATPVNWRAKPDEIDYFAKDSGAKAIVYEPVSEEAAAGSDAAQGLIRIAVGGAQGARFSYEDLVVGEGLSALPGAGADDMSLMFYTSGTTGRGKGVPRRHRAERAAAVAHVAQNQYGYGEITLGVMPLYHTMGVRSLLAMAVINGAFICQPRFDAGKALELIARERITCLYLVPTLYHDLLVHPDFADTDISSVRKLGFAGASMTAGLVGKLDEAFAPDLFVNHFGSSEIYTFTIDNRAAAKPGSAGRAGINTEIRVVAIGDTDPDAIAAPNEEGQIVATLSGDEAFEGYWNRPEADAASLHGGWYFTGDVGYVDDDGDLFVTGRVDDMIISGGENILPAEIESVLSLHSAVSEVAVVGLPDERLGQHIAAFVTPSGEITAEELDAWCLESDLANFKRPRAYVFVDEIPKSPVGKILRRELRDGPHGAVKSVA